MAMRDFFERAVSNITRFGDTDIFPFPIENHIMFDKKSQVVDLLIDINKDFEGYISNYPPENYNAIVPVNYTGFRSATQIDPLWNAYFLGIVISISQEIEAARIPPSSDMVFSYRLNKDTSADELFDTDFNWRKFMETSIRKARTKSHVVVCDISEFYPRLNHHRLENALRQLRLKGDQPAKIMGLLSNFSNTYSFGIPVGGPASRILSELALNQVDKLLLTNSIEFCRFADDYHIFCSSYEDGFNALLYLTDVLIQTQGLQLQKAKTRIMSSQEFISTSPFQDVEDLVEGTIADASTRSRQLLRFSIKFDPYSLTAEQDYDALKNEMRKLDLLDLLKRELSKSRIHISLARKIVSTVKYLEPNQRDESVRSIVENSDILYPIYANVLIMTASLFDDLQEKSKIAICSFILKLINNKSHVLRVELNLAYAIRILAKRQSPESEAAFNEIFNTSRSTAIRRDIILAMARWGCWYWLSSLRGNFRTFSPSERRAFLIGSFALSDEGSHWRKHITRELSQFDRLVKEWAGDKIQQPSWSIPL